MAGVYGEIDSRADFDRILGEAMAFTGRVLKQNPKNRLVEVIDTELDAMWRWSSGGRAPTEDERKSIDIALLAVREIEPTDDPQVQAWADQLKILNHYFEDWPTDDQAANATDDDFFDAEDDED
ncbi:MAG: hypothetical protein JNL79_25005 [Myxococcales bacterium]|nr:hypothetical protein [Myxococcales bacterium]